MFHIHKKRAWMKWLRVWNATVILSMALQPMTPVFLLAQEAPVDGESAVVADETPEAPVDESEDSVGEPEEEVPASEPETAEDDGQPAEEDSAAETDDDGNIPDEPTVEAEGEASTEREPAGEDASEEEAERGVWHGNEDDSSTIAVEEGKEYEYGDTGLKITFTKIDADRNADNAREITVKEVKLSTEQVAELGALSDTAWDITSTMEDGTFEYSLILPTPDDVDESSISVIYAESEDDLDDPKKMETVDADDVSVDTDKKETKVKDIDHFTVYVVTGSGNMSVTICHATASGSNPYTTNTVNINSIDSCKDVENGLNGHGDHVNDIIPPYQYVDGDATCTYVGKNWDTYGQAIWSNGCVIPSGTGVKCGDGVVNQTSEECDGEAGVDEGKNFCTKSCTLVPIYDGKDACPAGTLEKKVGGYIVGSKDTDGIEVSLVADTDYLFRVSGTFTSSSGGHVSDAGYTTQNNWGSLTAHGLNGTGNDYAAHALLGDMGTDEIGVIDWGEYDSDHKYAKAYSTGNSSVNAQFVVGDRYGDWFDTNWQNQGGMSDNSGSLALDVYECRALPAPVQTGYNENDGDPYATPRDPNELSCMDDFTLINGVSVHWTEVGVDGETVKYERQYAVGSGPWTGSEIYTDPYTNYRTFGGGSGTPGEYSSRVRAFIDGNGNNHVDAGEIVSEWSDTCAITYRVIDTLPEADPKCEDGKEYAKITTDYMGDIWFGDHYAPKNVWFELPSDASTSIGDEGTVLTYDGDDDLTVTLLAREDDARQDLVASIEFHGQEVSALAPETSGEYKLETESNCGSQCHIDGFATAGDRKVNIDFAVDVAHDRGAIKLKDTPVLCPIDACTLDFAVNNDAALTAIDLSSGNQVMKDTLAFGSSAADAHPTTGDVYYVERYGNRLAYYDISERENVVVGSTGISGTVDKLAFESTGALYAMTTTGQLYVVDTTNAASTSKGTSEMGEHEDGGDLVFGDDGDLYAIVKGGKVFEIDPETAYADLLGDTNIESTGMTFKSGVFYVTDNANRLYTFGKYSMSAPTLIGGTQAINDLARCPVPVTKNDVKICKHNPTGAALAGWEVALASETSVASGAINVTSGAGTSTVSLPAGKYLVKVDGTYRYGNSAMIADAGYSYRPNNIPSGCDCWKSGFDLPSGSNGLMAWVDGAAVQWGAFNMPHSYFTIVNHASEGPMKVSVWDDYYGDNVNNGDFRFAVYPIDGHEIGVTGDDGCVTFDDIAYGKYELGETQQAGWVNVSGLGTVTVDGDAETFTIVNRQLLGKINVTKAAYDPYGVAIADPTTDFTMKVNGVEKTVKDGATVSFEDLVPGTYTVEEVNVPGAYDLKGIATDEDANMPGTQVNVGPEETVSVTVTNWKKPFCGDGTINADRGEQCDGTAGVTAGQNFCTNMCKLVPVYDGNDACPEDKPFEKKLGSYQIGSKDADGESVALSAGVPYLFRVNGKYRYSGAGNVNSQADAAYATGNNWSSVRSDIGIRGTNRGVTSVLADLGRGVGVVDWDDDSAFDADHAYAQQFTPDSDTNARFLISDWYGEWYGNYNNQSAMGDNDGSIALDVYECVAPKDIEGTKYDYETSDKLSGWEMTSCLLENPANPEGACAGTETTTTDADGHYAFKGMGPGVYKVCEGTKSGYMPISPASRCYLVDLNYDTFTALGNIVANGGFENPVVSGWNTVMQGTSGLGWDVAWTGSVASYGGYDRPEPASLELQRDVNGWIDREGSQYAELDSDWGVANGEPANVKISQRLATCAGGTYEVSYAWSPRPGVVQNTMKVKLAEAEKATHAGGGSGNTSWMTNSFSFIATGVTTELSFEEVGPEDSLGMFLDDVKVTQTGACGLGSIDFYNREDLRDARIDIEKSAPEYVAAGQPITYSYAVTNPGAVALSGVTVTDDTCSPVVYGSGDADGDGKLDSGETWKYSCTTTPTWAHNTKLTNTAIAEGHYRSQVVRDRDSFTYQSFVLRKDVRISMAEDYLNPDNTAFSVTVKKGNALLDTIAISESDPAEMWLADDGSYDFCEVNVPSKYIPHYAGGCLSYQAGANNYPDWSHINYVKPVTIVAEKIVCDSEEDLPNWHGGPNITDSTASEWVGSHKGCRLMNDWKFQWGNDSVSNPGDDFVGEAGNGWNTFGPTTGNGSVTQNVYDFSENRIKIREVLQQDYLPFTYLSNGSTNVNNVTAEMYCDTDVVNYDNEEWLNNPTRGETYHCVAWNVKLGSIHGQKWNDEDGNGKKDSGEAVMDGWMIFLDEDGDKTLDEGEVSMKTSSDLNHFGWYWFEDLLPGEYSVCEVMQDGWGQTYPGTTLQPSCYAVTVPDTNPNGFNVVENHVEDPTPTYDFGNEKLGTCRIGKKNDADGPRKPGENVRFTLEVRAEGGKVKGVSVSDLPAEITKYVDGSWHAESSFGVAQHIGNLKLDRLYASPGVWDLGDLQEGEVVTLTYDATVLDGTDAGEYPDLAYAKGVGQGGHLYALATLDGGLGDDRFVGTTVAIADTDEPAPAEVTTDFHEKEKEVVKGRVLGATLPETGSPTFWIVLSTLLLGLGALLFGGGVMMRNRSLAKAGGSGKKLVSFLFACALGFGLIFGAHDAKAVMTLSDLFVRMEEPKADVGGGFTLDFVVLATEETDNIGAECQVKKPGETDFSTFETVDLDNEKHLGDSGQCGVDAAELVDDGTYAFRVKASANAAEEVVSAEYAVDYDSILPGKPKSIDKSYVSSCINRVVLVTADDGQTTRVEVYRSTDEDFTADASTLVHTAAVGPDERYSFDDDRAGDCGKKTYYAVRAFDDAGNASPVREEDMTETVRKTVYEDVEGVVGGVTLTPGAAGGETAGGETAGEEVVGGETAGEGAVTEGEVAGEVIGEEEGIVEGAETTAQRYGWLLWVLLAVIAGYAAYWRFVIRKAEVSAK